MTSNVELSPNMLEKLKEFFTKIFSSDAEAEGFLADPDGAFAAHGIDPGILSNVDINQLVHSCAYPAEAHSGGGGAGGGAGSAAASSSYVPPPQTVQQVTQVTQQYYQDNSTHLTDNSTNIDNSIDVAVDGDLHGDVDIESTNVNATGDGAVAAGEEIRDNAINTGTNEGIMVGRGDVENAVLGDNTGQFVGGDADGAVFGDNTGLAGGIDINTGGNTAGDSAASGGSGGFGGDGGFGGSGGSGGEGGGIGRDGGDASGGGADGGDATSTGGDADSGDVNLNLNFGNQDSHNTEDSFNDESTNLDIDVQDSFNTEGGDEPDPGI